MPKNAPQLPGTLGEYRGKDILSTEAKVLKAGDGLSATMALAPVVYDSGEIVTLIIRAKVGDHTMKYDDETGTYVLVQNFNAGAMIVLDDDKALAKVLDDNEAAIQAKKDAGDGKLTLVGTNTGTTGEGDDPGNGES